jgi:hypothetical protein
VYVDIERPMPAIEGGAYGRADGDVKYKSQEGRSRRGKPGQPGERGPGGGGGGFGTPDSAADKSDDDRYNATPGCGRPEGTEPDQK